MQVYIENVLWLRQEVEAGPVTVDELPASAAEGDIDFVFTDLNGRTSEQIVRPSQLDTLRRGTSTFEVNAGMGHFNSRLRGTFYRDAVFVGSARHGFSERLTGDIRAESIAGRSLVDAGADYRISDGQMAGFRVGAGNERRVQQFEYRLERDRFTFHERFRTDTIHTVSPLEISDEFFIPFPTEEQLEEERELSYSASSKFSLGLKFFRTATNAGFPSKRLALTVRSNIGGMAIATRLLSSRPWR